jgi:thiol-disulfide isomerase/thioredoxin
MYRIVLFFILPVLTLISCSEVQSGQDNPFAKIIVKGLCENPTIAATGKVTGSAHNDLILGKDSVLFVYVIKKDSAHLVFSGSFDKEIHKICVADADNDSRNDIVLLNGWSRYRDDKVSIYILSHLNGQWTVNEIYSKPSPRPQPVSLDVIDIDGDGKNEIAASYFESKYMVENVTLKEEAGTWSLTSASIERMATAQCFGYIDGEPAHVVGRVYGDELGETGDAYLLKESTRIDLKVYRGVRSAVCIGDGNNDGKNEIYIGDGWHQNYGKMARARIAEITENDNSFDYFLIEDIKGQTDVSQVEVADITGDKKNELIVTGNISTRIYKYVNGQWGVFNDSALVSGQFTTGNIIGNRKNELILVGKNLKDDHGIQILNFNRLPLRGELGKEVLTETILPDSLIGKPAPGLLMSKWIPDDVNINIPDRGKVMLLDFWATWCGPCKKMFPALKQLQEKYDDMGLVIIGLTRLDGRQTVESIVEFADNEQFNYPIGISEEAFNDLAYGVGAIPHMVLIDKSGIVRKVFVGTRDEDVVESEIIKLLRE